jgi:integrase
LLPSWGKAAGVVVAVEAKSGETKYASLHDLRRSFGERWASRAMPQVLMELIRHENIETTLRYYVGRNAKTTAKALWDAHRAAAERPVAGFGAILGPTGNYDSR